MNPSRCYALARLAYSVGLIVAPDRIATPWIGPAAGEAPAQIALRGLAARDAALAAAALAATMTRRSPRLWLLLCALGDLADVTATLAAPAGDLPPNSRRGTVALAGASAVVGLALAARS